MGTSSAALYVKTIDCIELVSDGEPYLFIILFFQ